MTGKRQGMHSSWGTRHKLFDVKATAELQLIRTVAEMIACYNLWGFISFLIRLPSLHRNKTRRNLSGNRIVLSRALEVT